MRRRTPRLVRSCLVAVIAAAGVTQPALAGGPLATSAPAGHAPAAITTVNYTVVRGDSLYGIASKTRTPISTLLSLNNLKLTSVIYPGQILKVLAPSTVTTTGLVRRVPFAPGVYYSYPTGHHTYPASDIFAKCGAAVVSPVTGKVIEVRRVDLWNATTDNPAHRGGRYIAILGDDGVRYYMGHFATVRAEIVVGLRVKVGQPLATEGRSGRAGMCHVHLGLSLPCPGKEYAVRRGVIWPQPYMDQWRRGLIASPRPALDAWFKAHPSACAAAMAMPHAKES